MTADRVPYSFNDQAQRGKAGEAFLDHYFARWFQIEVASHDDQHQGIDRFYTTRNQKQRLAVEYKTDVVASRTGNAFIELVSVDTTGKAGWAYTSKADYLLYYLPDSGLIFMLQMAAIRERLPRWKDQYPNRRIPNNGYYSEGVLVPLSEIERYAEAVFNANTPP